MDGAVLCFHYSYLGYIKVRDWSVIRGFIFFELFESSVSIDHNICRSDVILVLVVSYQFGIAILTHPIVKDYVMNIMIIELSVHVVLDSGMNYKCAKETIGSLVPLKLKKFQIIRSG